MNCSSCGQPSQLWHIPGCPQSDGYAYHQQHQYVNADWLAEALRFQQQRQQQAYQQQSGYQEWVRP